MLEAPGPWLPSKLLPIFPVTSQAQSPEYSSLSLASGLLQQGTLADEIIMSFPRTITKFASHLVESSRCLKHTQYLCSICLGHPCTFPQAWARCRLQIWYSHGSVEGFLNWEPIDVMDYISNVEQILYIWDKSHLGHLLFLKFFLCL